MRDNSSLRRAEEALPASDEMLSTFLKLSPGSVAVTRLNDGRIILCNDAFIETLGLSREEVIGHTAIELGIWAPDVRAEALREVAQGGVVRDREISFRTRTGRSITYLVSAQLLRVNDEDLLLSVGQDITQQKLIEEQCKRTQEALRESEARCRDILENAPVGIFQSTPEGRLLSTNSTAVRMFGYDSAEELLAASGDVAKATFAQPEKRREIVRQVCAAEGFLRFENEYLRKDGSTFIANLYMRAVREDGEVVRVEGFVEDITDRKQAEIALRESEARFASTFHNAAVGMAIVSTEGLWTQVNPMLCEILGYESDELIGRCFLDATHPDDVEMSIRVWRDSLERRAEFVHVQKRYLRKDGSVVWANTYASPVRGDDGQPLYSVVVIEDITRVKHAEEEKKQFYRETISSVTEGKLQIVGQDETQSYVDMAPVRCTIAAPGDLAPVRQATSAHWQENGLSEDDAALLSIALGEAMTNALKHAGRGLVFAGSHDDCVWVGVSDTGPGISTLMLPGATLRRGYSTKVSLGMGYSVMLDVADNILLSTGPDGTTVVLVKNIGPSKPPLTLADLPDTWDSIGSI